MNHFIKNKKLQLIFAVAILVVALEIFGLLGIHLNPLIELLILFPVIIIVGKNVLLGGLQSLRRLKFTNINLLMTVAIIGAILIGELEEAAVIIALFALSESLEDLGIDRSQSAINDLVNKTPKQIALTSGKKVNINDVKINDLYTVKPGDIIALDGIVTSGYSTIDEAPITGESLPSEKIQGSLVYSGSINKQGTLTIKVTKDAKSSTISRIADLTSSALKNKARYQTLIETFSKYYTPSVLAISILVVIIPVLLGQDFVVWFERAITLLVISCPCALVISTPISIFSAIGNASTRGILVKGGRFLEDLSRVKIVAFDKTRTLTRGEPTIQKVIPLNGTNEAEILSCAAGIEKYSEHPVAFAVVQYAKQKKLKLHDVDRFEAVSGKGIKARCLICNTGEHIIGNKQFLRENNIVISPQTKMLIEELQQTGTTPLLLVDNEGMKGIMAVSDKLKEEAKILVDKLHMMEIKTAILTGDNQYVAEEVGKALGIDNIKADLLPEDKVTNLKKLKKEHGMLAMIGDGVNDAPSLALSDIGIALGAIGSDIAIESADIALMNDRIENIPFLINLGKRMRSTIKFNVSLAIVTKFAIFLSTIAGITGLAVAVFADVGVTFIVILVSLRLLGFNKGL